MPICVPCGHENPPAARFCNVCGEPLDVGGGEGREARKTVTVLFCDVVGSTALAERHDPEVMRGMMARFYAAARAPIERHGGRVEKVIGDALVAVFGVPVVREDDALRAVRAALEMRDAVRAMGEVQIRIGVNTGEVLARDATARESLVVGDAVNVAARLEQAAPPETVLVGAPTWALVEHASRGERVPDISAKGKSQPLAAWRVDAVDPGAGAHRRRLDLPIVGREAELSLLRLALARARRVRRPHLVTLVGQPGIGKSRLVAELPRLEHGLAVCTGHCRATSMPPLTPLFEAARAALGGERAVADVVAAIMDGDDEAATVAACLSAPDASAAPDVAWAALRLFGSLASTRPVAIVLEDVHWADDELLAAVEQLVGRTRRGSLLVVCTARPEFADGRPAWASAASNAISLALERLDDVETRRLLSHASPGLEPDLADGIVATAEGNPLFAEHLAAVAGEGGRARGAPASIHGLLAARLEGLPAPEREVAEAAAVVGRDFRTDAAEALVGRSIVSELDRLAARELIDPLPPDSHQFAHALLHEAAYGLIPKQRRSALHARLAGWLVGHGGDDALVGDHLERAHRLRAELGSDDESAALAAEAGGRLAAAGRRADAMGDPRRARQLLERALDLLPEGSPQHASALVELAAAAWNLLPPEEVLRLLDAGIALAASLGLRALELRARIVRYGAIPDASPESIDDQELLQETTAVLRELESLDDPRALASALCSKAESEWWLGQSAAGVSSVQRAIRVLRAADEDTVWALRILAHTVVDSPMPLASADALLAELMHDLGTRPAVRSELMQGQALVAFLRGRQAQARALLAAAREIDEELGRRAAPAVMRARVLCRGGRYADARDVLRPALADLEGSGAASTIALTQAWLAVVEAQLGDLTAAGVSAAAALRADPSVLGYEASVLAEIALARVRLADGDAPAALDLARRAVAMAESGDWTLLRADARMTLSAALAASGEAGAAEAEERLARGLYAAKGCAAGPFGVGASAQAPHREG